MVCRLVQCKKVVWLEHQFGHCKTGTLATAQHCNLFVYIFTPEQECSQYVSQFCTDVTNRNFVQCVKYGVILVKDILLVLGKVSHIHVISQAGFTVYREEFPCDYSHKGSLALTVPSHKGNLLTPLYCYIYTVYNHFATVTNSCILGTENNLATAWCRWKLYAQGTFVLNVHLYPLKFVELFYTALYLVAFCSLIAEPLNELLCLLNHFLLVLVCGKLLLHTLSPQFLVFCIRYFIIVNLSKHNLYGTLGYVVQELAVVRDEHNRSRKAFQIILKPFN